MSAASPTHNSKEILPVEVTKMKIVVDPDLCIACGTCIDICPEVYGWNDEGIAHSIVDEVPAEDEEGAREALESCPTDAIKD